jgi:hypothetical protein
VYRDIHLWVDAPPFKESEHPRGKEGTSKGGQFVKGSGGGSQSTKRPVGKQAQKVEPVLQSAQAVASALPAKMGPGQVKDFDKRWKKGRRDIPLGERLSYLRTAVEGGEADASPIYAVESCLISKEDQQQLADVVVAMSKNTAPKKLAGVFSAMLLLCRGDVLDTVAERLSTEHSYFRMFSKDYDTFLKGFLSNWSQHNTTLYRTYAALQDFSGNDKKKFWMGGLSPTESQKVPSPNMRRNLERLYSETQAFLKKKYKTNNLDSVMVPVLRGIKSKVRKAYTPAPVESWTTDRKIAWGFAQSFSGVGCVLTTEVPASKVLMTYENVSFAPTEKKDAYKEQEIVILGGGLGDIKVDTDSPWL